MVGNTECVVSFGSGISIQWDQTQAGSLNISLRPAEEGVRRSESLCFNAERTEENTITFRVASHGEPDKPTSDTNEDERIHQKEAEDVRKLSEKITKKWESRKPNFENDANRWSADLGTFFGDREFTSSEQWSLMVLRDSEKRTHSGRVLFHKLNLSEHLARRIAEAQKNQPGFLESNCRKSMLAEIYPGWEELSRKQKSPLYAKFERNTKQGDVLRTIASFHAGLLLTVAPYMSGDDLVLTSKDLKGPWLNPKTLDESEKYDSLGSDILSYMMGEPGHDGSCPKPSVNLKRTAQGLQDDPPRKRYQLPNAAHLAIPRQRPFLPTPESSQEYLPMREQQARTIDGNPHQAMQPSSASTSGASSSILSSGEESSELGFPNLSPSFTSQDEVRKTMSNGDLGDTDCLILLLHALGGCVPELVFAQARSAQYRWSEYGTKQTLTALSTGLEPQLIGILSDENHLNQILESVAQHTEINGSKAHSLDSQLKTVLSMSLTDEENEEWSAKATALICFIFPRQVSWEPVSNYTATVRLLLPLLTTAFRALNRFNMPNTIKEEVSEVLLAASKAGNRVRQDVLPTVVQLLDRNSPLHLRAEMAHQQSISSRLSAEFDHSERAIHDFCCRCGGYSDSCISMFYRRFQPHSVDRKLNALYGRLHGSHLENLVQCDKHELAIQEIEDWQIPDEPSPLESRVRSSRTVTICKIFRSQGLFKEAGDRLELCLKLVEPQEPNRIQVLCSLADAYCDLQRPHNARDLIIPEINNEVKKKAKSKTLRRLMASMVDTDIQLCLYQDARETIEELRGILAKLSNLDVSDQLLHVRVLIASAKVYQHESQFVQAIQSWADVLAHVQRYESFKGEGYTYGVIHLSLSQAYLGIGNEGAAWTSLERAQTILRRVERDFWIPTLVAWAECVSLQVESWPSRL